MKKKKIYKKIIFANFLGMMILFSIILKPVFAQKLYVNAKVTNISEETIPYIRSNGCDPGVSVNLFTERNAEIVQVGGKMWNPLLSCHQALLQHFLYPDKTIQTFEVLIPPKEGFKEDHFVKIRLQNGLLGSTSPYDPIEIEIPLINVE